jgi:tRNA-dihydrouridine synthase B
MLIGPISIDRGVLLAPMEDVTDPPFRLLCRRLGADMVYTEFISSEGLIRAAAKSKKKLTLFEEERPLAIQIFGGDIPVMVRAARIAEEAQPDLIDLNCGCWVKGVVQRNAGAALLKEPARMAEMAKSIVDVVKLPVTVKTRLGWDKNSIVIEEVAQRLEQAGVKALTIHCRVRTQGHDGAADWSWIEKVKKVVSMPIILNGDVKSAEDVERAFNETGCDAVMIGRGAIQNPWVFRDVKYYMEHKVLPPPVPFDERVKMCIEHLRLSLLYKDTERRAVYEFRKFYSSYLKGMRNIAQVRMEFMRMDTVAQCFERLERLLEEYKAGLILSSDRDTSEEIVNSEL